MSDASERKRMRETLAAWSLMPLAEVAACLGVDQGTAKAEPLPWIRVGKAGLWKLDPLDLAVELLARKEGVTAEAYWQEHGEETPAYAGRYLQRLRKAQAA